MADKEVIRDMDMRQLSVLDDCSFCIEKTMNNTPMPSRTYVKARPGAVINNDVAVMNVPSIVGAGYFVTFIDKESGHVKAFHTKSKGETADLLKHHASGLERQSGCRV